METRLSSSEPDWQLSLVFLITPVQKRGSAAGDSPCLCGLRTPWEEKGAALVLNSPQAQVPGWITPIPAGISCLAVSACRNNTGIFAWTLLIAARSTLAKHFPYVIFMPQGSLRWGLMSFSWNICCKIKAACFSAKEIQPGKYREAELGIFLPWAADPGPGCTSQLGLPCGPATAPELYVWFLSAWSLR